MDIRSHAFAKAWIDTHSLSHISLTEFMRRITPASPRQALFERFSKRAMGALDETGCHPRPLVLLTGGLRTPAQFTTALGPPAHADLLGVGRGAILRPDFPDVLAGRLGVAGSDAMPVAPEPRHEHRAAADRTVVWRWWWVLPRIPLVGAGVDVAWYTVAMRCWATGTMAAAAVSADGPSGMMGGIWAVWRMWVFVVRTGDPGVGGGCWGRIVLGGVALVVVVAALGWVWAYAGVFY